MVVFPPLLASAIWKAGQWEISLSVTGVNRRVSCGCGLPGRVSKRARPRFLMKGLAQGGRLSHRGGWKMNGVAVGSTEVSFCLALRRARDGPTESSVTRESRKKPLVSRMAVRSGSLRLPGERAASRANNLPGWELSTALRDTCFRVPSWAPFLTSPLF